MAFDQSPGKSKKPYGCMSCRTTSPRSASCYPSPCTRCRPDHGARANRYADFWRTVRHQAVELPARAHLSPQPPAPECLGRGPDLFAARDRLGTVQPTHALVQAPGPRRVGGGGIYRGGRKKRRSRMKGHRLRSVPKPVC